MFSNNHVRKPGTQTKLYFCHVILQHRLVIFKHGRNKNKVYNVHVIYIWFFFKLEVRDKRLILYENDDYSPLGFKINVITPTYRYMYINIPKWYINKKLVFICGY